jgi:hypothetical protein
MVSPPARVGEGGAPQRSQTHPLRLTVRGVYLHFSNEKPNPAVKDWKVTTLQVSFLRCRGGNPDCSCQHRNLQVDPFKRHTDRQVVTTFWHIMDNVLRR